MREEDIVFVDRPKLAFNFIDKTGQSFGRWIVLGYAGDGQWWCRCECGEIRKVQSGHLSGNKSRSCNCLMRELAVTRGTKHGATKGNKITPEYRCWVKMRERCLNVRCSAYPKYGGRGIKICDRWIESFENFFADMGQRPSSQHSIERKDNNGDYSPDNCKWATMMEQSYNKRNTRFLTWNGSTHTLLEWAQITGFTLDQIRSRLSKKWTIERTLSQPQGARASKTRTATMSLPARDSYVTRER